MHSSAHGSHARAVQTQTPRWAMLTRLYRRADTGACMRTNDVQIRGWAHADALSRARVPALSSSRPLVARARVLALSYALACALVARTVVAVWTCGCIGGLCTLVGGPYKVSGLERNLPNAFSCGFSCGLLMRTVSILNLCQYSSQQRSKIRITPRQNP